MASLELAIVDRQQSISVTEAVNPMAHSNTVRNVVVPDKLAFRHTARNLACAKSRR
jgi:hypothetical protein